MKTKAVKKTCTIICLIVLVSCTKGKSGNSSNTSSGDKSPAGLISGTYTGEGKVLPDNVFLGNYYGCVTPTGWENNFSKGQSTVVISKLTDSTIMISMSSSSFNNISRSGYKVINSNNVIDFGSGEFDINSGFLSFSINTANFIFVGSPACTQGMPYYSGWSVLGDGNYGYTTHGRADFTGNKQ